MSDNDSERLVATPIGSEETEGEGATEQRAMLHAKGLVKRYGKRTVVSDVNFNVRQGEIVGLLGPNGAGKTTSFYMTTGLVVPNDGHVYLGDTESRTTRSISTPMLASATCRRRQACFAR